MGSSFRGVSLEFCSIFSCSSCLRLKEAQNTSPSRKRLLSTTTQVPKSLVTPLQPENSPFLQPVSPIRLVPRHHHPLCLISTPTYPTTMLNLIPRTQSLLPLLAPRHLPLLHSLTPVRTQRRRRTSCLSTGVAVGALHHLLAAKKSVPGLLYLKVPQNVVQTAVSLPPLQTP